MRGTDVQTTAPREPAPSSGRSALAWPTGCARPAGSPSPSTSDARLTYSVTGVGPRLADYTCSCPASSYGNVCAHTAAVALRRVQEQALADHRKQLARRAERVA
jgi:hypothetical protein